MKLVAAPNAFKGSLSAEQAAQAIEGGARRALPQLEVVTLPIADGGDGTAEVLCKACGGRFREAPALDALGRELAARYALLDDGSAVLDVATASGLARLAPSELDPLRASSEGTGQLVQAALAAGARRVVLGVGGSACIDGGAGVLRALGARLLDRAGRELAPGGAALTELSRIDLTGLDERARTVPIEVACDVDSPLLGEQGAARVFGPQKGASAAEIERLEAGLTRLAALIAEERGVDVTRVAGGGAAGGIAAGLHGLLGAKLVRGVELVLERVGFDRVIVGADLCVTGEGQLDRQSLRNKGPLGVARRAAAQGVPTLALVGGIAPDVTSADFPELAAMFSICSRPMSREQAEREAGALLAAAAEQAVRLFALTRGAP